MAAKKKADVEVAEEVQAEAVEEVKAVYVAAKKFRDIETGRVYAKGEVYEGDNPDRIKALSTKANKSKSVLIKLAE